MQSLIWFQFALLLLLAGCVSAGKPKTLIDDLGDAAEPVFKAQAEIVCDEKESRNYGIENFDTVLGVIDYVAQSMPECWAQYGESMTELKEVLTRGEDDYCGDAKLSLVEDFHHKYVSKIKLGAGNTKTTVPTILELFFIFYGKHLAMECKWKARTSLKLLLAAGSLAGHDSDPDKEIFERMLQEFDSNFSQEFSSHNHKDVFLFWNVVDSISYLAKSRNVFTKYVKTGDELTSKDDHRVAIKMQDGKNLVAAQNYCRKYLRPVYSRSILPVIRLTDMGYMVESLDFYSIDKIWYSITQFCEIILPIRVVEDSHPGEGQVVLLTKEEAAQLGSEAPVLVSHPANDVKLSYNRMKGNKLVGFTFEDSRLRHELNSRNDVVKRFLIKLAPRIGNFGKSTKGEVLLSKGGAGEEGIGQTISNELAELKRPTFLERTMDSLHRALSHSVIALPYVLVVLASPLILVAELLEMIVKVLMNLCKAKSQ